METVTITIDGQQYQVEKGVPLVLAAEQAGVRIPHLCFHEGLTVFAGCRLCVVQVDGMRGLPTSCTTHTAEGQVVWTKTPEVLEMQRGVMSLMLADHPDRCLSCHRQEHCGIDGICLRDAVVTYRCLTCAKNKRCEFQSTSEELEMHKYPMRYYQEQHSWYGQDHVELPIKRDNPFIELDFNECILCARCVRACDEVRGLSVYEMSYKGPQARIDTAFSLSLQEVGCDACGACVDVCPVACILDKPSKWKGNAQRTVTTTCPYCGDGCQLDVEVKQEQVLRVSATKGVAHSHGITCARGRNGLGFVNRAARLTSPLVKREGRLVEATWEEALDLIAGRLTGYRGGGFGALASPTATNEECYLLQKFTRSIMGSNNIDTYARLDHPELVEGLTDTLGYPAATNSLDDIGDAKCILLVASDTAVTHPIAAWQARRAARFNGGTLIVANPRYNEMTAWADTWLRYRPGTEVALIGGMLNVILDEGLAAQEFISAHCENFEAFRASVEALSPERASEITGLPAEEIRRAARTFATSSASAIVYDVGLTQYTNNHEAVAALADLALLTGNLGKPGAGLHALRGASNQQGAEDMGCRPDYVTGYQPVEGSPGLGLSQMLDAASAGQLKAMLLMGTDPVADDVHRHAITTALRQLEFLVVIDTLLTPTAQLADVVLPLAAFVEQDGTYTNTERRVQRVRQVLQPAGESRSGWETIGDLAVRMGTSGFRPQDASQVMDEIASVTPVYGGISHPRLEEGGVQWPCPTPDHPGTPVLYAEGFLRGKARFQPVTYRPLEEPVDSQYPLLLAAGRDQLAYHREVLTAKEDPATRPYDEELLRIHPDDALRLDIGDSETLKIVARHGAVTANATISDDVPPGSLFLSIPVLEDSSPLMAGPMSDLLDSIGGVRLVGARVEKVNG